MKYPSIIRDSVDFTNDTEICNIGYYEGALNDERPIRVEVWSSYGIISATIFLSTEDLPEDKIRKLLVDNKIIEIDVDKIFITKINDIEDNEFYSINVPLEGAQEEKLNELLVNVKSYE